MSNKSTKIYANISMVEVENKEPIEALCEECKYFNNGICNKGFLIASLQFGEVASDNTSYHGRVALNNNEAVVIKCRSYKEN